MSQANTVTVHILDKEYCIACPPEQRSNLESAARYLDGKMREIRSSGKVIGAFGKGGNKGIDVGGKAGTPVAAAGDGKVIYVGTGLRGYGKLVVIRHNAACLSVYAHNRAFFVKEGQQVTKGQKIAEMGDSDADQVKLHFEIRRGKDSVDPLKYLPQQ